MLFTRITILRWDKKYVLDLDMIFIRKYKNFVISGQKSLELISEV